MDINPKKPNKIRDIVRLQQILKKWRKLANSNSSSKPSNSSSSKSSSINHFLKRTLSLNDRSNTNTTSTADHCSNDNSSTVPKGYLAVSVGVEQKRFVIPTEYLGRHAFHVLLREAEEEFGFEQTGVLRIPCEVSVFENVLKMVASSHNNKRSEDHYAFFNDDVLGLGCCSSGSHLDLGFSHDGPMCS